MPSGYFHDEPPLKFGKQPVLYLDRYIGNRVVTFVSESRCYRWHCVTLAVDVAVTTIAPTVDSSARVIIALQVLRRRTPAHQSMQQRHLRTVLHGPCRPHTPPDIRDDDRGRGMFVGALHIVFLL
jgi:hypothetical protein